MQPLTGVQVIDVTQIMAGPFCTMLLGDMGADVIKIEKPDGGDDVRRSGPPFVAGESATFLNIGRNKRSVVIDMKRSEGTEIVRNMARDAEILVQNLRPGRLEGFGLGYEDVRAVNPAIVYATITGFGRTGPYKDKPGFDLMAQGYSGIMGVTGHPGQPPVKVSVPITDLNAGLFTAYGILAAYVNRLKTGKGQHVDSSLMEAGVAYTLWESAIYFTSGRLPRPNGSAPPDIRPVSGPSHQRRVHHRGWREPEELGALVSRHWAGGTDYRPPIRGERRTDGEPSGSRSNVGRDAQDAAHGPLALDSRSGRGSLRTYQ